MPRMFGETSPALELVRPWDESETVLGISFTKPSNQFCNGGKTAATAARERGRGQLRFRVVLKNGASLSAKENYFGSGISHASPLCPHKWIARLA